MKVKIGDVVYDSESVPVMLVMTEFDKENISNMQREATKYASFPDGWGDVDTMTKWMTDV